MEIYKYYLTIEQQILGAKTYDSHNFFVYIYVYIYIYLFIYRGVINVSKRRENQPAVNICKLENV